MTRIGLGHMLALRASLEALPDDVKGRLDIDRIVASSCHVSQVLGRYAQPVADVESLVSFDQKYDVIDSTDLLNQTPLVWYDDDDKTRVSSHIGLSSSFPRIGDLGVRLMPNMEPLKGGHRGGKLITLHQAGSACLFDVAKQVIEKSGRDACIISWGNHAGCSDELYESHQKSGASITCVVRSPSHISDLNRYVLAEVDGKAVIALREDLPLACADVEFPFVEAGTYVISTQLLKSGYNWEYRRRRYHENSQVYVQFERDLCQLTETYATNYVRL